MPGPTILGERLLLTRRRRGISQKALAGQLGISPHTLGRVERGALQHMRSDLVAKAARVLDVPADYLLGVDLDEGERPIGSQGRLTTGYADQPSPLHECHAAGTVASVYHGGGQEG